ncbi:MAG: type III-B CRISPR module RAMP protein Cmr1, partial [Gemmataceae bacterium]
MPRNVPSVPSGWQSPRPHETNRRVFEIELITPLFGGGVQTRENDSSFPIRPTSIRGQLQFWWRATVGAQYEKLTDLRREQTRIWGGVSGEVAQASSVQIHVEVVHADKPVQCAHYEYKPPQGERKARHDLVWNEPFSIPEPRRWGTQFVPKAVTYALFPFQGEKAKIIEPGCVPEVEPAYYIPSATFRLSIIWHKDIDFTTEVEPALWAWVNFGGLGSRTRRGCGAIYCQQFAPQELDAIDNWYRERIPATSYDVRDWPTLANVLLTGPAKDKSMDAWDHVIEIFRHFRQGEGLGRNLGVEQNRP